MKETPIFEEVVHRMIKSPGFGVKFLIGGLLSFIPIINLFAFGYLYRTSRALRKKGQVFFPEWGDWRGLFADGLRLAVVWLAYWLLPILLASLVAWVFSLIGLDALGFVLVTSVWLLANVLFCSALYRYTMRRDFEDLLDIRLILRMSWGELPRLILPSFAFLGVSAWLLPLYGFPLFGGLLILITYSTLRFQSIERKKTVSL